MPFTAHLGPSQPHGPRKPLGGILFRSERFRERTFGFARTLRHRCCRHGKTFYRAHRTAYPAAWIDQDRIEGRWLIPGGLTPSTAPYRTIQNSVCNRKYVYLIKLRYANMKMKSFERMRHTDRE